MLIDFRRLFPRYNIRPKGVLHIGANTGEEYPIYNQLDIRRQIWIEANPDIFLKLKQTISKNPEASCFCFAAGDEDRETVLHVANNGSQSSSVLELGTHKTQHPDVYYTHDVEVQMFRIDSFFKDFPKEIDFLNIDAQGFEGQILRGMGDIIKQFKWAYLEINRGEVYKGCYDINKIDSFMSSHGFRRVETKMVGNWGDALYIK